MCLKVSTQSWPYVIYSYCIFTCPSGCYWGVVYFFHFPCIKSASVSSCVNVSAAFRKRKIFLAGQKTLWGKLKCLKKCCDRLFLGLSCHHYILFVKHWIILSVHALKHWKTKRCIVSVTVNKSSEVKSKTKITWQTSPAACVHMAAAVISHCWNNGGLSSCQSYFQSEWGSSFVIRLPSLQLVTPSPSWWSCRNLTVVSGYSGLWLPVVIQCQATGRDVVVFWKFDEPTVAPEDEDWIVMEKLQLRGKYCRCVK